MLGKNSLHLVYLVVAALFVGCLDDPVRDHPLDPLGAEFVNKGKFEVRVTSFYPPRTGLAGIEVQITDPLGIGVTGSDGRYISPDLDGGTYEVSISANQYATIDTLVTVSVGTVSALEIPLPGIPVFTGFNLNSLHLSRWFPPPEELFSLEVIAQLDDIDGLADIDSVWLVSPELDFEEQIPVETEPGTYVHTIPAERLPAGLAALQGKDFYVRAKDRSGQVNTSDPEPIVRVIEATPLALMPDNLTVLSESVPSFVWEPVALQFPFTYRIDVVQINQNVESIVQTIEGIPASETTITAIAPLLSGNYFWTISIVDEYGNRSRSREAGFRIQ